MTPQQQQSEERAIVPCMGLLVSITHYISTSSPQQTILSSNLTYYSRCSEVNRTESCSETLLFAVTFDIDTLSASLHSTNHLVI